MSFTFCIDEVPNDGSRGFEVGGHSCFAVRENQQLYLYLNRCPHLGIQLNWREHQFLDHEGVLIQCSTHGALFRIDTGRCVSGPCLGQSLLPLAFTIDGKRVTVAGFPPTDL